MNDFQSLTGVSNPVAGTVVLSWDLHQIPSSSDATAAIRLLSREDRANAHITAGPTIVSVAVQRSPYHDNTWTTLATSVGADFAGSTYTDTPAVPADYTYRLEVVTGVLPHTTTLHSNDISASQITSLTLSASISGFDVALSWTGPAIGEYTESKVYRSADLGVTWFPIRVLDGQLSSYDGALGTEVGETLARAGVYQYKVCVDVEKPESPDAIGTDRTICSNIVQLTAPSAGTVLAAQIDSGGHLGPALVFLLRAAGFGILAATTTTNTGATVVTGDLGLSPGTSVTGYPPGTVTGTQHVTDTAAANAQLDLTTAYNDAAGRDNPTVLSATSFELGGTTQTPGLYKIGSSAAISTNLTLDAQGDVNAVWIFQIGTTLTSTGGSVILANGAQAKNIFWQVGSSATLGGPIFKGNILALTAITATTGVVVQGRLLARNAAVTTDTNPITVPV
jgi:hypothetical protein